jgi:hypothetical protein
MLTQDDGDRTAVADDTTIARRYLESVGSKVKLAENEQKEKNKEKPSKRILDIHEIVEGLRVWHHVFGAGTVLAIKDRRQGRLTVSFEEHGEMILLATYARLQPLG